MTEALVQSALLILAGIALLFLWRNIASIDRTFGTIVGFGLAARAIFGQLLFWISWLDLIPRKLHIGQGQWIFAYDGIHYLDAAVSVASSGPAAILAYQRAATAATYVELLSLFALLFGRTASIGVLVNLFTYVFSCWLIARLGAGDSRRRRAALFALIAITIYPANILWSSQPLKDPLLQCLFVVLIAAAANWQRIWHVRPQPRWIAVALVGFWISVYAISGSRWYFGLAILGASMIFLFLVAASTPRRRLLAALCSLLMFLLLSRAFLYGSGVFTPGPVRWVLSPTSTFDLRSMVEGLVGQAAATRSSFERSQGATEVRLVNKGSPAKQWMAGLIAVVVPHFLVERMEFIEIGGGRGLFWFADLDTFVFDGVILMALLLTAREFRRGSWSNPLLWLVLFSTVFLMLPLLYAVTNFGALFRFRGMIYVPLALAPLAAVIGGHRPEPKPGVEALQPY